MARKKETPKPLSELRFEFVASLENVCQQAIMLLQAVDTVIQHDTTMKQSIKDVLSERSRAMRAALISEDQ